jgi:DNA-binding CsgD family transcriptional regulator
VKSRSQRDAAVAQALELACLLPVGEIPRLLLQAAGAAEETLDALVRDGSLEPADEPGLLRWTKPESPDQIRRGMAPATRQTRSLALAEAARDLRLDLARVAAFFEEAQRLEPARDFWLKAAEKACAAGDYANAMGWLDRALKLWPWTHQPADRVRALKEAARCATNAGMREQAGAAWRELAEYAADTGRVVLEVAALGQLAACASDTAQIGHCLRRAADVLRGLARGLTSKEIASELGLSTRTVEMHVARLLDRLDCRTRTEAVKIAVQKGWA